MLQSRLNHIPADDKGMAGGSAASSEGRASPARANRLKRRKTAGWDGMEYSVAFNGAQPELASGQPRKPRVLFLNPPHRAPLMRRYMCTYASPLFLLPPNELLQLAACARAWNGAEVEVLDAIAEARNEPFVHARIRQCAPDVLVALVGVDSIADDMACLDRMKGAFPALPVVVFGYYPTTFPETILQNSRADFILRGEPEAVLSEFLSAVRTQRQPLDMIPALAGRRPDGTIFANAEKRIENLDRLPFPDYALIDIRNYAEALLGGPCGAILSARGCPYQCSYCTPTFGRRLVMRSPEGVVAEMQALIGAGARVIRFLDDTFTCNRKRVMDICRLILERNVRVRWTCLSRLDTFDRETLAWMKRAGCARILLGVESYSEKVLNYLKKGIDPKTVNPQIQLIREAGIESWGFLLLGAPVETEEEFEKTFRGIMDSSLDFISINILTPYQGTSFFEQVESGIDFSLIPYVCRFRDESVARSAAAHERRLFRAFYLRPATVWRRRGLVLRYPHRTLRLAFMMLRHWGKTFHIHETPGLP